MSNVLVTDKEGVRFVAQHITPVAGCMADMQEGGRTFLNQIIAEKKADVDAVTKEREERRNNLYRNGMDAEIVLKQGPKALKELKMAAVEEWTMPGISTSLNDRQDGTRQETRASDIDYEKSALQSL